MNKPIKNLILVLLLIASQAMAGTIHDDAPTMTVTLRTASGAEVRLTYQALLWDSEVFSMLQSMDEDEKQIRDYYRKYITPRLAQLTTNVTLKGPSFVLAPGVYRIGFVADGAEWSFVAGNREGRQVEFPVVCETQPFETRHLAFLLVPGASQDALQLVVLYGPHTVRLGFLLTGELVQVSAPEPPLYKLYFGGLRGEEIPSATPSLFQEDWRLRTLRTPTPKRTRPSLSPGPPGGALR